VRRGTGVKHLWKMRGTWGKEEVKKIRKWIGAIRHPYV
jgi:hypothetical protein